MVDNIRYINHHGVDGPVEQAAYLRGLFDGAEREAANHDAHRAEASDLRRRATWIIIATSAIALLLAVALVLATIAIVLLLGVTPDAAEVRSLITPSHAPSPTR